MVGYDVPDRRDVFCEILGKIALRSPGPCLREAGQFFFRNPEATLSSKMAKLYGYDETKRAIELEAEVEKAKDEVRRSSAGPRLTTVQILQEIARKEIPPVRMVNGMEDLNSYPSVHYIGVGDTSIVAESPKPDGVVILETEYGSFAIRKDFVKEYKRRFGYK